MSWNYRVVEMDVSHPRSRWLELREVYYDENGAISWVQDPGGYGIRVTVYHGWAPFRDW